MRAIAFLLAFASIFTPPDSLLAQVKEDVLPRILADWQHRQGLLKSARYVINGTVEFKEAKMPPGVPARPRRVEILLDLEAKRFRMETSEETIGEDSQGKREFVPRVRTSAFDRKSFQQYVDRVASHISSGADLSICKGELTGGRIESDLVPIFWAHGIVASVHGELRPDKLPMHYDLENFEFRGRQLFKGRPCLICRTEPIPGMAPSFDEFWIDRERGSAIYRHLTFTGYDPIVRTDAEWKQTEFGWQPDQWTHTWTLNGKVWKHYRMRIESFEANPKVSNDDFTIPARPGMLVEVQEFPDPGTGLNPSYPATKTYRILPSGAWEELSAKGFTTLEGKVLPPERRWLWLWTTIALGIGSLVLVFYLLRRRRRASPI